MVFSPFTNILNICIFLTRFVRLCLRLVARSDYITIRACHSTTGWMLAESGAGHSYLPDPVHIASPFIPLILRGTSSSASREDDRGMRASEHPFRSWFVEHPHLPHSLHLTNPPEGFALFPPYPKGDSNTSSLPAPISDNSPIIFAKYGKG